MLESNRFIQTESRLKNDFSLIFLFKMTPWNRNSSKKSSFFDKFGLICEWKTEIVAICVKSDCKFKFFIRIRKKNSANSITVRSIEWLDLFLQHKIQSVRFDSLGAWLSLQLIDQLRLIHCIDHIVVFSLSQIIVIFLWQNAIKSVFSMF